MHSNNNVSSSRALLAHHLRCMPAATADVRSRGVYVHHMIARPRHLAADGGDDAARACKRHDIIIIVAE